MIEKIETNLQAPKFKVNDRDIINKYKNIFSKACTDNWSREIVIIDSILKTNPWNYKTEYFNREKKKKSVYRKELLWSIL